MSDLDSTLQQGLTPCITLGIQIGSQVVVVLRNFLDYWYLQLSQTDGSEKYATFLKESKGAYFKDELEFAAVAFDLHKSNIYREPVSKEERLMLQKMCRKMGIDYCLAKRPGNLDELITKKYVLNQSLSPQEEKLVNAFLCLDEKGNPIFETEDRNGHKIPKVRDDAYLLTIAEKDLPKWDLICTHLEAIGKRTLEDLTRDVKVKETVEANLAKDQKHPKQEKTQSVEQRDRMLSLYVPKTKAIQEKETDSSEQTVKIRITGQDYIIIPAAFVKLSEDKKGYEIEIPETMEVTVITGGKAVQRPVKDIQHLIPVPRVSAERGR